MRIVDFFICLSISFGVMVVASLILNGFDRAWARYVTWRLLRSLRRRGRRAP